MSSAETKSSDEDFISFSRRRACSPRRLEDGVYGLPNFGKYLWYINQILSLIKGDIGTSPLYVFSAFFILYSFLMQRIFPPSNNNNLSPDDVIGAVSCIIWSLTLIPLIKYCWLVLRVSQDLGEGRPLLSSLIILGGTFVFYRLLSQAFGFDKQRNDESRHPYHSLQESTNIPSEEFEEQRHWISEYKVFRIALLGWTLLGASCVIADGLLTPVVSVISAVGGTLLIELCI